MSKKQKTILSVWVEDTPGVLWRVTELFGSQNFNIESLTVGATEKPGVARLTIILGSEEKALRHLVSDLNRITNLVQVKTVDPDESVQMELALLMVDAPDEKKTDIINIVNVFRARIVDVATNSMTVAVSGSPDKVQALHDLLHPFGILEAVRTGIVAIDRGVRGSAERRKRKDAE